MMIDFKINFSIQKGLHYIVSGPMAQGKYFISVVC